MVNLVNAFTKFTINLVIYSFFSIFVSLIKSWI